MRDENHLEISQKIVYDIGIWYDQFDMEVSMNFQKLSAPSLKELFVSELENKILSGELAIGSRLPSERELAASMQVSRAVVNSGISEMEKKGFLVVKPRIGTFVEDYRKNGTLDTLVSIMKYNGGNIGKKEVKAILEMRVVLVGLAGKLAIESCSDEELATLLPLLEKCKKATDNDEVVNCTFHLYHELAYLCGNSLLPLFFMSFRDLVTKLWTRFVIKYGIDALIDSDIQFVDRILTRDYDGLMNLISANTQESIDGSRPIYD